MMEQVRQVFDPCALLFRLATQRAGKDVEFNFSGKRFLILQNEESLIYVLRKKSDRYIKTSTGLRLVLGGSRLVMNGENWQRRAALSQPFLSNFDEQALVTEASRAYARLGVEISAISGRGAQTIPARPFDVAALTTSFQALYETPFSALAPSFLDDIDILCHSMGAEDWNAGSTEVEPAPLPGDVLDARSRLLAQLDEILRTNPGKNKLLSRLLKGEEEMPAEFEYRAAEELLTLLFVSYETLGSTMTWAAYLLGQNQKIQKQLRAEVEQKIGMQELTPALVRSVDSIRCFLEETMRVFATVPFLGRIPLDDDRIGDMEIKAGQVLVVSIVGHHLNPKIWPDPHRVVLDRHQPGANAKSYPFSIGPRVCGGRKIGLLHLAAGVVELLRTVQIERIPGVPMAFEWTGASMRRKGGQPIQVSRRTDVPTGRI